MVVRFDEDENLMYLRKTKGGACVCKTQMCIVFGSYNTEQWVQPPRPDPPYR